MNKPNFYAILPATVRYDNELGSSEKLFYAEITAMSEKEGYCWASNTYFSDLFGVSKNTITRWVSNLKNRNHVIVNIIREGRQITRREIYPIQKIGDVRPGNSKGGTNKNVDRGTNKNVDRGTNKNGEENNTSINNTSINIPPGSENREMTGVKEVTDKTKIVDFLKGVDLSEVEDKNIVLACYLWRDVDSLIENNTDTKKSKLLTWSEPIRLMVEQDGRTHREIYALWKRIQENDFERAVVLSPSKLRKRFNQLQIKLTNDSTSKIKRKIDSMLRAGDITDE